MSFGLFDLMVSAVLFANALAILHERRFLAKYGWDRPLPEDHSVKARVVTALYMARVIMQLPLLWVNIIFMLYLLVAG